MLKKKKNLPEWLDSSPWLQKTEASCQSQKNGSGEALTLKFGFKNERRPSRTSRGGEERMSFRFDRSEVSFIPTSAEWDRRNSCTRRDIEELKRGRALIRGGESYILRLARKGSFWGERGRCDRKWRRALRRELKKTASGMVRRLATQEPGKGRRALLALHPLCQPRQSKRGGNPNGRNGKILVVAVGGSCLKKIDDLTVWKENHLREKKVEGLITKREVGK